MRPGQNDEREVALLIAYVSVARGVQAFPAATRQQRAEWIVQRGAEALCDLIEQAGAHPDAVLPIPETTH